MKVKGIRRTVEQVKVLEGATSSVQGEEGVAALSGQRRWITKLPWSDSFAGERHVDVAELREPAEHGLAVEHWPSRCQAESVASGVEPVEADSSAPSDRPDREPPGREPALAMPTLWPPFPFRVLATAGIPPLEKMAHLTRICTVPTRGSVPPAEPRWDCCTISGTLTFRTRATLTPDVLCSTTVPDEPQIRPPMKTEGPSTPWPSSPPLLAHRVALLRSNASDTH